MIVEDLLQLELQVVVSRLWEPVNSRDSNGGSYFSEKIYKDIDRRLRQCLRELEETYAQELNAEIKRIERECANKLEEEKKKRIDSAKKNYDEKMENLKEKAEENIFGYIFKKICGKKLGQVEIVM